MVNKSDFEESSCTGCWTRHGSFIFCYIFVDMN